MAYPREIKTFRLVNRIAAGSVLLVFLASGCGLILPGRPAEGQVSPASGEKIYFTASSDRGSEIYYSGGPAFGGMMMGTYLTCAACHGPDGRGGAHWMHMQYMVAPDIRISALSQEGEEHGQGGFDLEDFRTAVFEGMHPDGEALSRDMPRWRMSEADLADLFSFLQSLP